MLCLSALTEHISEIQRIWICWFKLTYLFTNIIQENYGARNSLNGKKDIFTARITEIKEQYAPGQTSIYRIHHNAAHNGQSCSAKFVAGQKCDGNVTNKNENISQFIFSVSQYKIHHWRHQYLLSSRILLTTRVYPFKNILNTLSLHFLLFRFKNFKPGSVFSFATSFHKHVSPSMVKTQNQSPNSFLHCMEATCNFHSTWNYVIKQCISI